MTQPLTDEELDSIMTAALALRPRQRAAFEQQCISELLRLPPATRGPGSLHRVIAACQRSYIGCGAIAVGPARATSANTARRRCGPRADSSPYLVVSLNVAAKRSLRPVIFSAFPLLHHSPSVGKGQLRV